jgi:hypothetical protein
LGRTRERRDDSRQLRSCERASPTQTTPILATSPALNAVPIAACQVHRDQRGVRRPQGKRCDVGSFERKA